MRDLTLVTGATGFIGSYVVRRLVAAGAPVRVLVRRPEALPEAIRRRVDVRQGDVSDPAALPHAVEGVRTVLHLAACARAWSRDPREFVVVNVEAVERLLQAAWDRQVERLVHVSTILTLPPFRPAPGQTGVARLTPYEQTKRAGEWLVESYAVEGRQAVIVHPARVYGPGPLTDANAVTRVVGLYLSGRFPVRLADGDVLGSYVHADDVAAGIVLAAQLGRRGAHYVLGGENASFRRLLELAGEVAGVRRGVVALPPALAMAAAHAAALWGRLGGRPPITPGWVRVFLEDRRADIALARQELGYAPRPLRQGLAETIAWLQGVAAREAA